MSDKYLFETQHFRFTINELHLLRSRFAYKKIPFDDISRIFIKKGIRVKRPILGLVFGISLVSTSLYFLMSTTGAPEDIFRRGDSIDEFNSGNLGLAIGYWILVIGLFLAIGLAAVFQATFPTWIMRAEFANGKHEVFGLGKIRKMNQALILKHFLKDHFQSRIVEIDENFF